MKKTFLLSAIVLLSSCITCNISLSQIPPQYVYCDNNCNATLPDFRLKVVVRDNCGIESVSQLPAPGTVLSSDSPITVTIRATDRSKNFKQIKFIVSVLDTIAPTIDSTQLLVDTELDRIDRLYDQAELAIYNKMKLLDDTFPYEKFGLMKDDVDSTFFKQTMITWTPMGHAVVGDQGYGHRYWTWESPGDTIHVVKNYY
jgi:hypothetical protein